MTEGLPLTSTGFEFQGRLYVYRRRHDGMGAWALSGPPFRWRSDATPIHTLKVAIVQAAWEAAGRPAIPIQELHPHPDRWVL